MRHSRSTTSLGCSAIAAALFACGALVHAQPVSFTDQSALLDFEHRSSEFGGNGLSGAAWFDFDEDGLLDLFIPNGIDQSNTLFRNLGGGLFDNVAAADGRQAVSRAKLLDRIGG